MIQNQSSKRIAAIVIAVAVICIVIAVLFVTIINPMIKYNRAVSLMSEGEFEKAIAAFEAIDSYKDSNEKITECKYELAVAMIDKGNFVNAYNYLVALKGYKDSAEMASYAYLQIELAGLRTAIVGDIVNFGSYWKGSSEAEGKTPIEWIVLDKEGDKLLLISKYGLDFQQYDPNTEGGPVTWAGCFLRGWLNATFMSIAFSEEEQERIVTSTINNPDNPQFEDAEGGPDTTDKLFLLSFEEARKYFSTNDARKCMPTVYADEKGKELSEWYKAGEPVDWWLRSPGFYYRFEHDSACAGYVSGFDGEVVGDERWYIGCNVDESLTVRPAMWINP